MYKEKALSLAKEFELKAAAKLGTVTVTIKEEQNSYSVLLAQKTEKLKVMFFFGKKGIKVFPQGDTNTAIYREVSSLINPDSGALPAHQETSVSPLQGEPAVYIGTDESGKGDYFGPLVIAGVGVNPDTILKLRKIGVRDSKMLTDGEMAKMYPLITEACEGHFNIITINPAKYNELYSRIRNLNKLLAWGHAKTIENILTSSLYPEAISDKFGDESYIISSLQKLGKQIKLHQMTRAERYTAVAAASILARHTFAGWFYNSKNKFGYELKKGASKEVEKIAGKIIKEKGMEFLNTVAKVHFKTTQQSQNLFM